MKGAALGSSAGGSDSDYPGADCTQAACIWERQPDVYSYNVRHKERLYLPQEKLELGQWEG